MTELLEKAVAALRRLPVKDQDDIARALLGFAESDAPDEIEPEHRAAVLEGLAQAERGEFASDAEVEVALRRFGA